MLELKGRRSRARRAQAAAETWPGPLVQPEQRDLADEAVPIPESPHVAQLRSSKGGPYYLAPDSAEPLPEGMWADLDPKTAEAELQRINERYKDRRLTTRLPQDMRVHLEQAGPAARRLLATLERNFRESETSP